MPEEMLDSIQMNSAGALVARGGVAQTMLQHKFNVGALRSNATLRKDEWIQFDEALIDIATLRMVGVGDLLNRGLRFDVTQGLGSTTVEWETVDETREAEVNMDGINRAQNDRVDFVLQSLPLPIIHRDFEINSRALQVSRTRGEALDTTNMRIAGRKVSERIEQILFNGITYTFAGASIFGYTTHPNRNTVTLATPWDNSGITGELILTDILAMISAAHTDRMFGPYVLYVPTLWWIALLEDFKANSDKSILTRMLEIPTLEDIKVSDFITVDNAVMVQMTSDVVDMVVAQQPTTVQWETDGGFKLNFKVMAVMIPRLKADADGRSGIIHLS